ncbi:MAG: S1C family serine protease [Bacteroidota bacterium]
MKKTNIGVNFSIAFAAALLAVFAYVIFFDTSPEKKVNGQNQTMDTDFSENIDESTAMNFTAAAQKTVYGVVHVKTMRERDEQQMQSPLEFFFGPGPNQNNQEPQVAFGSGVIVSEDGYIITNDHVIKDADDIEVTLNDQRTFQAEVKGTDPNTDIALLKIDQDNLPYLDFGDSDAINIGQWVLAVGNPFGLTSSVTAGIISAKERTLGVLQGSEMPIESFLQTDAAINVGNSGGALVNLQGQLIGVPTLIISPTQTNIGTGFAVPSSIVEQVKEDIIEFGEVRRGVLGIAITEVNSQLADQEGLESLQGIFLQRVIDNSAADNAGLQEGDVILEINDSKVNTTGELQRQVAFHNPGEEIDITYRRNGNTEKTTAELISTDRQQELLKQEARTVMGATLKMVPEETKENLNLRGGVQVTDLDSGKLKDTGMREGFIIVAVNKQLVTEPYHVETILENYSGNVYIDGIYPDGESAVYAFGI